MSITQPQLFKNYLLKALLCLTVFFSALSASAQTFTTLDDFSDGNFTANPVWTVVSGNWQVGSGVLQKTGLNGTYQIRTPFTKVCNAWEFRFDLNGSGFAGQRIEYYFFMTSASGNPSSANGYRVSYSLGNTTAENTIRLERVINGVGTTIVSHSNISGDQNIRVTRDNNQWVLFTEDLLRGTGTDATYSPTECAFQGGLVFIPSTSINYVHGFDNIRYAEVPSTIAYANLQFPASATIAQGSSIDVFAQVFESGVTEAAGPGSGISAWIGYSTTNNDPSTWTNWVPATFNVQVGNNDEFKASIGSTLSPGNYYYASRFQRNGGAFVYGGYNAGGGGFWNGTTNVSGVLTINQPPAIYQSYAVINSGSGNTFYDLNASTANPDFEGFNLGTFNSTNTLILNGGQNRTDECPPYDVFTGKLSYAVYKNGSTPGSFALINLGTLTNISGALCPGGRNEQRENTGANINLLSGLCDGNYTLEISTQADYSTGFGTPVSTIFANNGGSNYKATFTVNNSLQSGIFESYVIFKKGTDTTFYNLKGAPNSTLSNFNGLNLGSFCQNESLVLLGGENKTFKCTPNDVFNGKLYYKIYSGTSGSGGFSEINLPFNADIGGAGPGCQDQKWQYVENATNILANLAAGTYTIEVYTQAGYTSNGVCPGTHFSNNGGANYKATFTVLALNTYYQDADGDNYGTDVTITACSKPAGYALVSGDCNDNNAAINPGATEVCDGIDNNCDGQIDEGFTDTDGDGIADCIDTDIDGDATINGADCAPLDASRFRNGDFFIDADGDGFGTGTAVTLCYGNTTPLGYSATGGDCNDQNSIINPAATEVCDGIDNNCDGQIDEGFTDTDGDGIADCVDTDIDGDGTLNGADCASLDATKWRNGTFYVDADGDGYGVGAATTLCYGATTPAGYATQSGDCNDADASINPAATEVCDGIDNNCDGQIDEGLTYTTYYIDSDGDGYGTDAGESFCTNPGAGYATQSGDCNDADASINPGTTEVCNGIDDNCDGQIDEGVRPAEPALECWQTASFDVLSCQWIIKEKDLDAPTITAPSDVLTTTDTDGSGNCTTAASLGTPTIGNDCGVVSVINDAPLVFASGVTNVTWTVTNRSGKSATAIQKVTVIDNEKPSITCPANIVSNTDPGSCTKTLTLAPPAANDNCGIATNGITGVRSDGLALSSPYPLGVTTITWMATDVNGLQSSNCIQTITINKVNTLTNITSVTVIPGTQQYSDRVTFTATVTPGGCATAGEIGGEVTFRIGTQIMGTAPVVSGVATLSSVPLLEPLPSGTPPLEQLLPGIKTVTAVVGGTDADYIVSGATTTFTITKENAVVDYTGQEFASTGSATASTARVRLSATVRDITAVDPATDSDAGIITNAKARFIIRRLNPTNMSVAATTTTRWLRVSLLGTDTRIGSVSIDTTFNIGSSNSIPYEIAVEVDSFYTSNTNSIASLVVSKTVNDFVTFGGHILMNPNTSAGLYPSNTGSRLNFGGQAKWNKNNTNLQGGVNIIWRTGTKVYQIKGIVGGSNGSLSVNTSNPAVRRATIVAKANVNDTETGLAVPNTSGSTVVINLRDRGEPGSTDSISIELRNGAGLLIYSSNWTSIRTNERMLTGGNIQINGTTASPSVRKANEESISSKQNIFDLKVLSNPTIHNFGLKLTSADKVNRMTLRVMDVNGRIVEQREQLREGQNLMIGDNYDQGIYFAELIQGDQRKVVRLLKLK